MYLFECLDKTTGRNSLIIDTVRFCTRGDRIFFGIKKPNCYTFTYPSNLTFNLMSSFEDSVLFLSAHGYILKAFKKNDPPFFLSVVWLIHTTGN